LSAAVCWKFETHEATVEFFLKISFEDEQDFQPEYGTRPQILESDVAS
jgi:hypothetical protein